MAAVRSSIAIMQPCSQAYFRCAMVIVGVSWRHMIETFRAGAKYEDWEGTAAADNNFGSLREYLENAQLIGEDDFLVSASMTVIEGRPYISAYVYEGNSSSDSLKDKFADVKTAIPSRQIKLKLSADEFIKLFKIFSVVLTWKTLDLTDRTFEYEE